MQLLCRSALSCAASCSRAYTGWGPNRLYKQGNFFVGTEYHVLKYYNVFKKTPDMPYGLVGRNHLLPFTGKIAFTKPTRVNLKKDHVYLWCNCGYSGRQPLCDGTHNRDMIPNRNLKPVRYIAEKDETVWLCNCKQTKNRPFCDGSHKEAAEELIEREKRKKLM